MLQKSKRLLCALCLSIVSILFLINTNVLAQTTENTDTLVVSAHRYSTPASKVSSAVTIFTAEDIKRLQVNYVHDVLRTVPYLDVISSGGQGGNVSIFMRGANSEHTLVLIDDIEINNPASTNRAANLNNLTVDNIERIEILRGSQSMPYGSDALGGVIAIYTKTGSAQPQTILDLSGGAYNSFRSAVQTSGQQLQTKYTLAAAYDESAGISAAQDPNGNTERDGYQNTAISGKLGFGLTDQWVFNLISRYTIADADIDNNGGAGGDDLNRKLKTEQLLLRGELAGPIFTKNLQHTLAVSWSDNTIKDRNDPDQLSNEFLRSVYDGDIVKLDLINRWNITDDLSSTLGIETKQERASSNYLSDGMFGTFEDNFLGQDMSTNSVFLDNIWTANKWLTLNAGTRIDDNSKTDSEMTYRAGPVICIADCTTRLTTNIGTGYKAPSLFQLYSTYGNRELQAEESFSWEVGLEQEVIEQKLNSGITFFRNEIDNLVTFNNQTFVFENVDQARIYGFEIFTLYEISENWTWRNDYAYSDARNLTDQSFLLRRARNKFSSELTTFLLAKQLEFSLRVTAFDGRYDNDFSTFPAERVQLPGYALLDFSTSYKLNNWLELYSRVENILDKEYQEVLGFGTPGVAAYGGIKIQM